MNFILGFFAGAAFMMWSYTDSYQARMSDQATAAIKACELKLPRTEKCVIAAIPEKDKQQ